MDLKTNHTKTSFNCYHSKAYSSLNKIKSFFLSSETTVITTIIIIISIALFIQQTNCNSINSNNTNSLRASRIKRVEKNLRTRRHPNLRVSEEQNNSTTIAKEMKLVTQNSTGIGQKRSINSQPLNNNNHLKRFKTAVDSIQLGSIRLFDQINNNESAASTGNSRLQITINNNDLNNNNNNNTWSNDINNNTIESSSDNLIVEQQTSIQRNISSINGTIDLSQYGQNDVDRLYGDALLVYFKNFNE